MAFRCCFQTTHVGEGDVENHDVWGRSLGGNQDLAPVVRFGYDFQIALRVDQDSQPGAKDRVIIPQEYARFDYHVTIQNPLVLRQPH